MVIKGGSGPPSANTTLARHTPVVSALMDLIGEHLHLSAPEDGSTVRREVRARAARLLTGDRLDELESIVGEAIANAVSHGSGKPVVTVAADEVVVRVEVRDSGPAAGSPNGSRVDHGRGLEIIDAWSDGWDLTITPTATCLWFEVYR